MIRVGVVGPQISIERIFCVPIHQKNDKKPLSYFLRSAIIDGQISVLFRFPEKRLLGLGQLADA